MLEDFRQNMRGFAFAIVVVIGIIFAFSGVGTLTMSSGEAAVLVNGENNRKQNN